MSTEHIIIKCNSCGANNRIPKSRIHERPICGKCRSPLNTRVLNVPVTVTDQTFNEEVLSRPEPVLVDCWAPWCAPCHMVAPVLEQLASEYQGRIKIAKLNVDENPTTSAQYGIRSIPTMLIFKNGRQIDKLIGALPRQEIEQHVKSALSR